MRTKRVRQGWPAWMIAAAVGSYLVAAGIGAVGATALPHVEYAAHNVTGAQSTTEAYFRALGRGDVQQAETYAVGAAAAALSLNTTGRRVQATRVLSLSITQEEGSGSVALENVEVTSGGALPTFDQYQVLALLRPAGWRVADVWTGASPATLPGTVDAAAMQAIAQTWLRDETAGNFQGALHTLAGDALTSAEQTGQSGVQWAKSVTVSDASWQTVGTEGSWGAIEGRWKAATPSGTSNVDLVLLGQLVAGQWRITRVVMVE